MISHKRWRAYVKLYNLLAMFKIVDVESKKFEPFYEFILTAKVYRNYDEME